MGKKTNWEKVAAYVTIALLAFVLGVGLDASWRYGPKTLSSLPGTYSEQAASKNSEDGSEYWPPILGVKLKITDSLLAAFTALLWLSTHNLWTAARRQSEDTQASVQLAREEFISTHRPRLILREAFIGSLLEGEPIDAIFTLANVGETAGRIIHSSVRLEMVNEQYERLLLHASVENQNDLGMIVIGPGAHHTIACLREKAPKWDSSLYGRRAPGTRGPKGPYATVHLVGQIVYVDNAGVPRRTAFRRVLRPERQRFYRINYEPDCDYAD